MTTLTSILENHLMTKNKLFLIVASKLFELGSFKTSQMVENKNRIFNFQKFERFYNFLVQIF